MTFYFSSSLTPLVTGCCHIIKLMKLYLQMAQKIADKKKYINSIFEGRDEWKGHTEKLNKLNWCFASLFFSFCFFYSFFSYSTSFFYNVLNVAKLNFNSISNNLLKWILLSWHFLSFILRSKYDPPTWCPLAVCLLFFFMAQACFILPHTYFSKHLSIVKALSGIMTTRWLFNF